MTFEEQFTGNWSLISMSTQDSDGNIVYPFGKNPTGIITYTKNGRVSVHIMENSRPIFTSQDQHNGSDTEIRKAFEGYVAYSGTYTISKDDRTVSHHVETCLFPNWIGITQKRSFHLSDNRLTLKTPSIRFRGKSRISTLVWERMP